MTTIVATECCRALELEIGDGHVAQVTRRVGSWGDASSGFTRLRST